MPTYLDYCKKQKLKPQYYSSMEKYFNEYSIDPLKKVKKIIAKERGGVYADVRN